MKFLPQITTTADVYTLERNIHKLRLLRMLMFSVALAIPTMFSFWSQYGLSMTMMMGLEAIFGMTMVLTELPAGVIADRYGRKFAIVVGSLIMLIAGTCYAVGDSFTWFVIAEICLGAGMSFIAGADESMLHDSLRALGQTDRFEKTWEKLVSAEMLYCGLCFLFGGTLGAWNLRAPFYILIGCFVLLVVTAFSLREPRCHTEQTLFTVPQLLRTARVAFVESDRLRWLILMSAFLCGANQGAFWTFQPYFKAAGIPLVYNGVIFFSLSMVTAAIARRMTYAEAKFGALKLSMLVIMAMSLCLMIMANVTQWWVIFILPLFQSGRAFYRVSISHFFHREAVPRVRATIISARNMIDRVSYSVVLLSIGWSVDRFGLSNALAALGMLCCFLGALIIAIKPKREIKIGLAEGHVKEEFVV